MLKSIFVYAGLAVAPANVLATPRSLILEESEIRFLVKEMGVPSCWCVQALRRRD